MWKRIGITLCLASAAWAQSTRSVSQTLSTSMQVGAVKHAQRTLSDSLTTSASATGLKNTALPNEYQCAFDSVSVVKGGKHPQLFEQHSVSLSWTAAASGADWYTVYRAPTASGPFTQLQSCVRGTSYVDRTVTTNQQFFYVVTTTINGFESAQSGNAGGAVPPFDQMGRGQLIPAKQISQSLTTSSAISIQVARRRTVNETLSTVDGIGRIAHRSRTFTETLTTSATFTVAAPHSTAQSESLTTTPTVSRLATYLRGETEPHQVNLSWSAPSTPTPDSYNVYRSNISGGPYALIASGVLATSYADSEVGGNQIWYYTVTAVSGTSESQFSNEFQGKVPPQDTVTAALLGVGRSLTQTLTTVDSVVVLKKLGPQLAESLTTGSTVAIRMARQVAITQTLTTSDNIVISLNRKFFVILNETLITTDSLNRRKALRKALADDVSGLVDDLDTGNTLSAHFAENIPTTASVTALLIPATATIWDGEAIYSSGNGIIPPSFFGLQFAATSQLTWPGLQFGAIRLWDTSTTWADLNPAAGTFSWTTLDNYLVTAKANGVNDVVLTLSATPTWIATNPNASPCDYGNGSCSPPSDLNADGTGSNQTWRDFIYALGSHLAPLNPASFAQVTTIEMWNEFSRSTSWLGTNAQLLRMTQEAHCILVGTSWVTAVVPTCTAAIVNEPNIGMLPRVLTSTPSAVPQGSDLTAYQGYLGTTGALPADIAAVHAYSNGSGVAYPDEGPTGDIPAWGLATQYNSLVNQMPDAGFGIPIWSTAGSWGDTVTNLPDSDMQQAFVARYFLTGWAAGFDRMFWYAANSSIGTLLDQNGVNGCVDSSGHGCLRPGGLAWQAIYSWMVGNEMVSSCAPNPDPVWTCDLVKPDGTLLRAVWDTSQTCSGGSCGTSQYIFDPQFQSYTTLGSPTPQSLTGTTVAIGAKPILLSTFGLSSGQGGPPQEDLINWVMMDSRRFSEHLVETFTYKFGDTAETAAAGTNWAWIKSNQGRPWDINHYDQNFLYLNITENGDQAPLNPSAYKRFLTRVPWAPRFYTLGSTVQLDSPGSNQFVRTLNCELDGQPILSLGLVRNITTTAGVLNWGGNVGNQLTILVSYFWGGLHSTLEEFWLVKNWGRVQWDSNHWNGTQFVRDQTSTHNTLGSGGTPELNFPCGFSQPFWQ